MTDSVTFWNRYKKIFGSIKNTITIEIVEKIIRYSSFSGLNEKEIAYVLATAYHETGFDFIPKREFGNAEYFIKKYWTNSKVAKWLGNDSKEEAIKYCGRGLVQITGETNYERFGIADNPEKALEADIAVKILVDGMNCGHFTGKKLRDYINKNETNYFSARRIINGIDKADVIASYSYKFYQILE